METPAKVAFFGTIVTVNFKLIPLLKGLTIEVVHTRVRESQQIRTSEDSQERGRSMEILRSIVEDDYRVSGNAQTQEVFDAHGFPTEGYIFARNLDLPKNLRLCMQSAHTKGFRIKHSIEFNIQMRNPDEHMSEVR